MITLETHNRVRAARRAKGLTLHQVAQLVGTTSQVIHYLETRGKRRPYSIDLELLASALGTTVDELFPVAATRPGTPDDPADNEAAERSA